MSYSIGIDIGGTKIEAVLMNEQGKVFVRERIPTVHNKKTCVKNIEKLIDKINIKKIEGIGIGVPGLVSHEGKLLWLPNLKPLEGMNLKEYIEKKYKTRVSIQNDAKCFTLAEWRLGAGKNTRTMVGLVVGTGIGSGIVMNKQLVLGGAGEVGHIPIYYHNKLTSFEELCSGKYLLQRYKKNGGKLEKPYLRDILKSSEPIAKQIAKEFFEVMGLLLATIVDTINPDIIVVGGGVSNTPMYEQLNKEMKKQSIPLLVKDCKVVKNTLGDSAGVLGAGMLVFEHSF